MTEKEKSKTDLFVEQVRLLASSKGIPQFIVIAGAETGASIDCQGDAFWMMGILDFFKQDLVVRRQLMGMQSKKPVGETPRV